MQRRLRGLGVTLDADQQAAQKRQFGFADAVVDDAADLVAQRLTGRARIGQLRRRCRRAHGRGVLEHEVHRLALRAQLGEHLLCIRPLAGELLMVVAHRNRRVARRVPDESGIDVAPLPAGHDLRLRDVPHPEEVERLLTELVTQAE